MPADRVTAMMAAETWFNGNEAKALGWATELLPAAKSVNAFNLTDVYANVPAELAVASTPARVNAIETRADLERMLRDRCNLTNSAAKKVALNGFAALESGDVDDDDPVFDSSTAAAIERMKTVISILAGPLDAAALATLSTITQNPANTRGA